MNRSQNETIKSLYNNDRELWKNEADARMTQCEDERIEQIRTRAHKLKATREAERLEFVKDCYHRQWRESCDEMRVLQSKEMLNQIVKDRQLDTQNARANNDDDKSHSGDMCILHKEEGDKQQKHHESILRTRRALDTQIELKQKQAAAAASQRHLEEQEQMRLASQRHLEEQQQKRLASEKAKQKQKEVLNDTLEHAKEKQLRQELEKHQDAILLQHALALEREAILAEQAKKHDGKEASEEFIRALQEQTQHEEAENETVDKIRSQQMYRIAKVKEDRLKAEQMERQRQQELISWTREQQILRKSKEAEMEQMKEKEFEEEARSAVLRADEAERRGNEKARLVRLEVSPTSQQLCMVPWTRFVHKRTRSFTFTILQPYLILSRLLLRTRKWQRSARSKNDCGRKR